MKANQIYMKLSLRLLGLLSFLLQINCSKNDSESIDKSTRPDLYTYVPDDNFEQLLINQGYDDRLDNYITNADVVNVTFLLFTSGNNGPMSNPSGISDFTGIEAFVSLESLDCSSLNLTSLNLNSNTALKSLNCSGSNLTSLNLSNLSALRILNCSYNNLTSLQFNGASLEVLSCHENNLSQLDLSSTNSLISIDCFGNNLSSLDLGLNTALNHFAYT